ncbi:hypothetical protein HYQ46_003026 [Verticillium longisporum]|nr:hypothetical protein HYQ46_003026 [Verticillium longisporum]
MKLWSKTQSTLGSLDPCRAVPASPPFRELQDALVASAQLMAACPCSLEDSFSNNNPFFSTLRMSMTSSRTHLLTDTHRTSVVAFGAATRLVQQQSGQRIRARWLASVTWFPEYSIGVKPQLTHSSPCVYQSTICISALKVSHHLEAYRTDWLSNVAQYSAVQTVVPNNVTPQHLRASCSAPDRTRVTQVQVQS